MEPRKRSFEKKLQGGGGRTVYARHSLLLQQTSARSLHRYGSATRQLPRLSDAVVRGDFEVVRRMLGKVTRDELNQDDDDMTALHYAAKHGHDDIALLLLDNGASIDKSTRHGGALQAALKNRKEATATILLHHGASVNVKDADGMNALHLAVYHRITGIVMKILKEYKLDPDIKDSRMSTALHYAALNGDVTVCRALIKYGAMIDITNASNETALHLAAGENNKGVLKMLLNLNFKELSILKEDFVNMERKDKKTALHLAAQMGHTKVIKRLVAHGADVHGVSSQKESPLHLAVSSGNGDAVKLVLKERARVDTVDKENRTPLHYAVAHGHDDIVEKLLSNSAPLGSRDNQGNTPFLLAVKNANVSLALTLLDKGADILDEDFSLKTGLHCAIENHSFSTLFLDKTKILARIKDEDGRTPLHYAAEQGCVKILKALTARTMQYNETDNYLETALHLAARNGNVAGVELLIKDPDAMAMCNQDGHTPLHLAVIYNRPLVCQVLLQRHVDVNREDKEGWTPLFYAAYHDNLKVLQLILEHNDTKLNCTDKQKNTCLMIASELGNAKAVDLLLECGADLRCVNTQNETFFDQAINSQNESVCRTILESSRWSEALSIRGDNGSHFMDKLIKNYPHLVEIILNRSISFSDHPLEDPAFTATFNFQFLEEHPISMPVLCDTIDKAFGKGKPRYFAPKTMLKHKRQQLLDHPIVSILMEIKWNKLCRHFYYLRFLVFLIHIILLNIFVYSKSKNILTQQVQSSMNSSFSPSHTFKSSSVSDGLNVIGIIILLVNILQTINEVFRLLVLRCKYFYRPENYIEILLYVSIFITLTSIGLVDQHEHASMALCVFLAWTNLLFYLQGIPFYSIYVTMYLRVCATIIKLLLLFGIIFICFTIIFGLLRIENDQFKTNEMRILTLFTMMNGEVGLSDWWLSGTGKAKVPFPITTYGTMLLFLLFIIMAFTNLLIGLAVGDIESIRSSAKTEIFEHRLRLVDAIHLITPNRILKTYVYKRTHTYHVNKKTRFQKLIKYILPQTIDDDLKQLRVKQDSFNYNIIKENNRAWTTFDIVTVENNSEALGDNNANDKLLC